MFVFKVTWLVFWFVAFVIGLLVVWLVMVVCKIVVFACYDCLIVLF